MICERCLTREASVHIEQLLEGKKTATHLCAECADKQSDVQISFDHFFQGFLDSFLTQVHSAAVPAQTTLTCERCGLTYPQFKQGGRLGCTNCYDTFKVELSSIFKNMQASNEHQGKYPKKSEAALYVQREIEQLKTALTKAVEDEAFEEAATYRDAIKRLREGEGHDEVV